MMGVYIKGQNLPKKGEHYLLQINSDGTVYDAVGRRIAAQAVPVPPHGRLIDAGNLGARAFRYLLMNGEESPRVVFAQAIKDAPTIIPASEEVYARYTDTAGNTHWTGTRTGEHIIPAEEGE